MRRFFENHKRLCTVLAILLTAILAVIYLRALYAPGLWHRDTFLRRQSDGSFAGSSALTDYRVIITPADDGAELSFTANDETRVYRIYRSDAPFDRSVRVLENGEEIFRGKELILTDDYHALVDESGNLLGPLLAVEGDIYPNTFDPFPALETLYNWAFSEKTDIRGNPAIAVCLPFILIILALDIAFPDLFFMLKYGLAVDGGEPSDLYRTMQKVGRFILAATAVVCIITSLLVH